MHRRLIAAFSIGLVLGAGIVLLTRKAVDAYENLTERLDRIEAYIGQLDRLMKSR